MAEIRKGKEHAPWDLEIALRKGLVIHDPKAVVAPHRTKAKFFVVLENPPYRKGYVLVCMTSSRPQDRMSWDYERIEVPSLSKGYTWVLLNECHDVPIPILKQYSILCLLSDDQIKKIDKNVWYCHKITQDQKWRILRKQLPKNYEHKSYCKMLDSDEIASIKKKLKIV